MVGPLVGVLYLLLLLVAGALLVLAVHEVASSIARGLRWRLRRAGLVELILRVRGRGRRGS